MGGESCYEETRWSFPRNHFTKEKMKMIVMRVLEVAVLICMGTHAYTLCGQLYIQSEGGPIGMWFTSSLTTLVMKMWDDAFLKLANRVGLNIKL